MNTLNSFVLTLGLSLSNALLPAGTIFVTLPKKGTLGNPYDVPKNVDVQGVQTGKFAYIASKDADPNFRVNVINEEIAKVKIPTETTDELLFLANQREKESPAGNVMGDVASFFTNGTVVSIKNNSNLAIECALTALHTTPQKTALFSRKYNKYIAQTAVSIPVVIKPQSAGILTLDPTGANIANTETVIAITVGALQMTSKKHVLEREHFKNETILVSDITTNSWISNNKKKITLQSQQLLEFPNDFVHALTQNQAHEGPNYYNLIAYMRACERIYENSSEKVDFPVAYYNPDYISHLDKKELDNLYSFILKKFNQKYIPVPVGLSALLECGKYNFIAGPLADIMAALIAFIIFLTPGLEGVGIAMLALETTSFIMTIVDDSIAIGQGVAALKAKGRG